jgi:hypothetical protein
VAPYRRTQAAVIIYRIEQLLGGAGRGGINAAVDVTLRGVAKDNAVSPFTVANEVIAATLGQALGLPVASGVVARAAAGNLLYVSLDVSADGKQLPPIVASDFVRAHSELAARILAFDIWTANEDRHTGTIALDPNFAPPRPSIFDHGHALLGSGAGHGPARLTYYVDKLGFPAHYFLEEVRDDAHLWAACERIGRLPHEIIVDACSQVTTEAASNVAAPVATTLSNWLTTRQTRLPALVNDHHAEFTKITAWGHLRRRGTARGRHWKVPTGRQGLSHLLRNGWRPTRQ